MKVVSGTSIVDAEFCPYCDKLDAPRLSAENKLKTRDVLSASKVLLPYIFLKS